VFLVKISSKLEQAMEDYAEDEDSFESDDFELNDDIEEVEDVF